jgi:phosphoserine phosphatase RsbU-like protein/GAF domain-containing protein
VSAEAGAASFRPAYARALQDYLRDPDEGSLRVAYELGRDAVRRQLSVLDLAISHQEALLPAMTGFADATEQQRMLAAAGDFLLESLSSFEMVQRGYGEAREAAWRERRRTEMSRQLSTFLADASLALDDSGSLEEMLRLVAEQVREILGGDCCMATVAADDQPRTAEAASYSQPDTTWAGLVRWLDLPEIYRLLRVSGGSLRLTGNQLSDLAPFRNATGGWELRGWLGASLTALDGRELGAIQLFDKQAGRFTEDDEAALVHIAQTASAAVERAGLYQRGR